MTIMMMINYEHNYANNDDVDNDNYGDDSNVTKCIKGNAISLSLSLLKPIFYLY